MLPDPVIQPGIAQTPRCHREVDEELVGSEVVDYVMSPSRRVVGALDVDPRVLVAPVRDCPGSVGGQHVDRGAPYVAGADHGAPGVNEIVLGEPGETVLAAAWSLEEKVL